MKAADVHMRTLQEDSGRAKESAVYWREMGQRAVRRATTQRRRKETFRKKLQTVDNYKLIVEGWKCLKCREPLPKGYRRKVGPVCKWCVLESTERRRYQRLKAFCDALPTSKLSAVQDDDALVHKAVHAMINMFGGVDRFVDHFAEMLHEAKRCGYRRQHRRMVFFMIRCIRDKDHRYDWRNDESVKRYLDQQVKQFILNNQEVVVRMAQEMGVL